MGKIVELIENSLDTWKYNQRIESILRELKDRIDTVYLVSKFAEVDWPTPILYITLNFDRFGEIDAVEHIAPVGTVFQIHEYRWDVVRITTDEYPFSHNRQLFIHKDFVSKKSRIKPVPQEKIQPSKEEILRKLKSIEGADYVRIETTWYHCLEGAYAGDIWWKLHYRKCCFIFRLKQVMSQIKKDRRFSVRNTEIKNSCE